MRSPYNSVCVSLSLTLNSFLIFALTRSHSCLRVCEFPLIVLYALRVVSRKVTISSSQIFLYILSSVPYFEKNKRGL
jgi:hypothetical protein